MPKTQSRRGFIVRCLLENCICLRKLEHCPFGGIGLFPVDGRGSFCAVCRRITPDWPQAAVFMSNLQQAINGTKYQEPTQEMVNPVPLLLWPRLAQSRCRCGIDKCSFVTQVFILRFWAQFSALMQTSRRSPLASPGLFVCLLRCGIKRHVSIANFAAFAHSLVSSVRSKPR